MTTELRAVRDDPLVAACLVQGIALEEPIGRGRFAVVWRARWRERDVAVKVVAAGHAGTAPGGLRHPAILGVLATGEALGRRLLVLERFPTDLRRLLGGRPLRRDLLRPVLVPLLDALDHAHRRGVAHGDLKPANVLVDPAAQPPRVALADFGVEGRPALDLVGSLPSLERDEAAQGAVTLPYLAPERRSDGGPPTPAADVYALGALLFELLTGRAPGGLELPSELAPGVDRRWDGLVKLALARDPAARPAVERVRREVLRLLPRPDGGPAEATAPQADDMVHIEGGYVVVGDEADPDARPMREVSFGPFWLDRTPVTHRAWLAFVQGGGGPRPTTWPARGQVPARTLDLPVTGITFAQAELFAAWSGKRLPTEWEWERAAQGPEHRRYPWGDAFDPARSPAALVPVFSTPLGRTSEGLHDLSGNGWEWTASWFVPPGQAGPGKARTIRGGRDPARPRSGSAHHRAGLKPDVADPLVGFRCAR